MDSGVLATAGAELYWQAQGEGPAVVLAHGIGGNHAIWYRQLDALSRSNRVIAFDHRGFGLSRDIDGRGRDAFVDDLTALLDHLGETRVALVGQSMGAGTCIGFAHRAPERVAALAVCDSLHGIEESAGVKALMDAARATTAAMDQIERVLGAGAPRELAVIVTGELGEKSLASLALVGGTLHTIHHRICLSLADFLTFFVVASPGALKRLCIGDNEEFNGTHSPHARTHGTNRKRRQSWKSWWGRCQR